MKSIWDLINYLGRAKTPEWTDATQELYSPYVINKAFSNHADSVLFANEMNLHHQMPKKWQHDVLFYGLRKYKRPFTKWAKPNEDENIKDVMIYFQYNRQKAQQAMKILTEEDLMTIRKDMDKGGVDEKRNSRKDD